ncbi:xanthine dehydrogenase family protein molybdopterin-binding subunit [Haloarcula sp. S1CR25-12]|uniref:Xanthine dehydrogenase family protein molybdopterin-binding subunit n=1 Tax=Haloarcula saliterrae TaxID=2950534 RepID=A0ABU2FGZ9_9EURY|nr:xanthine dehydrogenase family protein molybdopterin-binding subunit [Haloarcula sp. S1CR25-12]MDS0261115.1 xanthine dehydrogenase family protein molybdopterin-binding subunit [Haloarcula sp. S1CR25-12]
MTTVNPDGGIGESVSRNEDRRVLTGNSTGTDDFAVPNALHVQFLRSEKAHARFSIDASAARARSDVVAVYTAADIEASETPTPEPFSLYAAPMKGVPYPDDAYLQRSIATDRARYHGEIIGVVVGTDQRAARDALDDIDVTYDTLEPVMTAEAALADDAPVLHDDVADNIVFEGASGDEAQTQANFETAAYTAELEKEPQRVSPCPLEPRAAVAVHDPSMDTLEFVATTQIPHGYRRLLSQMLHHPEHKVDVTVPDMGGGFGARQHPYPADVLVGWCALDLSEPVRWRASRTENQLVENDGRGYEGTWEIALGEAGDILALRADIRYDLGAWVARGACGLAQSGNSVLPGQYDVPAVYSHVTGVVTNKARVDAYRGVTGTEMIMMLERLVTRVAKQAGLDPAEVRRRNFVDPDQFPYENATGAVYDSGDYARNFEMGLEAVDYEAVQARKEALRDENRYLGVGLCSYIEGAALGPCGELDVPTWGYGRVQVHPGGEVTVYSGGANHGQGHETSLAQIATTEFGVPFDDVSVVENSTKEVSDGVGTFASRTAALCGSAITESCRKIIEKGRQIAADEWDVPVDTVAFDDGAFHGASEQSLSFQEIAAQAHMGAAVPDELEPGLEEQTYFDPETRTWSFGTHVAVVELDPDTGAIEFHDYVATEDCGVQLNPDIVEGQVVGGIAQGIGQTLYEDVEYDSDGTLLSDALRDETLGSSGGYTLPKAEHIPEITVESTETPSPHTPHGAKGMGESGAIAAPGAIMNAIADALEPFDTEPMTPPVTPEMVWRAMAEGGSE